MKNREYYERLISDSLDRELSEIESEELKQALQKDPDLVQFQRALSKQAEDIRTLPELYSTDLFSQCRDTIRPRSLFQSIWQARVSIPVPVAALVLLILIGFGSIGLLVKLTPDRAQPQYEMREIKYVEIERLKPAVAILVEPDMNQKPPNKEEL